MKTTALFLLVGGLALGGAAAQAAEEGVPRSAAVPKDVVLKYSELDYGLVSRSCAIRSRSEPFKKEPAPGKGALLRGYLQLGDPTTNSIPFLWHKEEGRLYLDLNRNSDLTDDPGGVFSSPLSQSLRNGSQTFSGIRLPLKAPSGVHLFKLELMLYSYGENATYAVASLQSCWRGKTSWQGQDAEFAVIEGPWGGTGINDGPFLVLRPWQAPEARIDLLAGTPDAVNLPGRLFWRGAAAALTRTYELAGKDEICRLQFTPEKPVLGEINVRGGLLTRVILEGDRGYTAVLEGPAATARIPVGAYKVSEVWLKKDGVEAVQDAQAVAGELRKVQVRAESPASLLAGGPLTNSVSINRRGKSLVLNYQLVGVDGGAYRLLNDPRTNPPSVTISHSGKQVTSGKFAYG
jgi:hypothetical protein